MTSLLHRLRYGPEVVVVPERRPLWLAVMVATEAEMYAWVLYIIGFHLLYALHNCTYLTTL